MANHTTSSPEADAPSDRPWPADIAEVLCRAGQMLEEEGPRKAFELLAKSREASPWLTNARGVCLLRMGETQRALELFRGLAMAASGHGLNNDAPTQFKTNYATAQLLAGNMTGCIVALGQARDEGHPAVQNLRAALRSWRQGLSFWEKVCSALGADIGRPVELDFPPGDL
jgi:hypothetical protein